MIKKDGIIITKDMKICICGGGSLGHVCAGVLGSLKDVQLNILSGHPSRWQKRITVTDGNGKKYIAQINHVSSRAEDVIVDQDIILICLPGFLIEKTLIDIKPYIGNAVVGSVVSSTGFFFFAHDILGKEAKLFGFQRVPFISRVVEYGRTANLLGYKSNISMVLENIKDSIDFCNKIEQLFATPVTLLNNFYEVALSNSNPILHTGRLYALFAGREHAVFDHNVLFYKEWNDESSSLLIQMDLELFQLLERLGVHSLPSLLDYYESTDAASLTKKIQSIPAFQNITSPMKLDNNGWIVDYESRYFTEDFPFGLRWIKVLADEYNIYTPTINKVLAWGLSLLKKEK